MTRKIVGTQTDGTPLHDGDRIGLTVGTQWGLTPHCTLYVTVQTAVGERSDEGSLRLFKDTFARAADVMAFYRGKDDIDAKCLRRLADAIKVPPESES